MNITSLFDYLYNKGEVQRELLIRHAVEHSLQESMSLVIATYNRSEILGPLPEFENKGLPGYSPLFYSVYSLMESAELPKNQSLLKEVIIVDDASTKTDQNIISSIESLVTEEFSCDFSYIKLTKKVFCFNAFDIGFKKARARLVISSGDDHFCHPNFMPIGVFAYSYLDELVSQHAETNSIDTRLGVVFSPYYLRSTTAKLVKLSEAGRLHPYITSPFDKFPLDLLNKPKFIPYNILYPHNCQNIGGIFFGETKLIKKLGGFNSDNKIEINRGGESNLSIKLLHENRVSFWVPDPRFNNMHLRVGWQGNEENNLCFSRAYGLSQDSLKRIIYYAKKPNYSTGNRRTPEDWLYLGIRNHTALKKLLGAQSYFPFLTSCFKQSVTGEILGDYYANQVPLFKRLKIYFKAIRNGSLGWEDHSLHQRLVNA